jgi:hypothetical protein
MVLMGSTSPTLPTATNTRLRKMTANKPLLTISKPIEEHIDGTGIKTDITNTTTAKKILTTHGLILPTAGTMLKQIAMAIFKFSISARLSSTHMEILRAFALLLHDAESSLDMTKIINRIKNLIGSPLMIMAETAEELATTTEKHKNTMEDTVKEVRTNLTNSIDGIDKAAKTVTTAMNHHAQAGVTGIGSEGPRSYAAVAKSTIPIPLTKLLSCTEGQSRQILTDRRSFLLPNDATNQLTEEQLVSKAKLAIKMMKNNDIPTPEDLTFISACKLPYGGILYKLNSKESAEWFNTPANQSNFLK